MARLAFEHAQAFARFADEAGPIVVEAMRIEAPSRSGQLRRRLGFRRYSMEGRVEVFGAAPHTGFVAFGTRPHTIRPRTARVLRFEVGGNTVYARKVEHPGTHANPFHERGWQKVAKRVEQVFVVAVKSGLILESSEV